jgi:hypothetical protein
VVGGEKAPWQLHCPGFQSRWHAPPLHPCTASSCCRTLQLPPCYLATLPPHTSRITCRCHTSCVARLTPRQTFPICPPSRPSIASLPRQSPPPTRPGLACAWPSPARTHRRRRPQPARSGPCTGAANLHFQPQRAVRGSNTASVRIRPLQFPPS